MHEQTRHSEQREESPVGEVAAGLEMSRFARHAGFRADLLALARKPATRGNLTQITLKNCHPLMSI
jgi:hypothetical protein